VFNPFLAAAGQGGEDQRRRHAEQDMPHQAHPLGLADDKDHLVHPQQQRHQHQRAQHPPDHAVDQPAGQRRAPAQRKAPGDQPVHRPDESADQQVYHQPDGGALLAHQHAHHGQHPHHAHQHAKQQAAVELNARIDGQRLYIAASGLPRNHIFTVRARWHSYDSWVRIARVASNRNGALQKNIRLPSYLARAYRLNVCLKDVVTGRTYCTRARRRY
jgi:hypothetical protein